MPWRHNVSKALFIKQIFVCYKAVILSLTNNFFANFMLQFKKGQVICNI